MLLMWGEETPVSRVQGPQSTPTALHSGRLLWPQQVSRSHMCPPTPPPLALSVHATHATEIVAARPCAHSSGGGEGPAASGGGLTQAQSNPALLPASLMDLSHPGKSCAQSTQVGCVRSWGAEVPAETMGSSRGAGQSE